MDIVQTFIGIIVISFIIERLFEIASSTMDWYCCRKPPETDDTGWKQYFTAIDQEAAKKLDTFKRLIFTTVGILASLALVLLLGVGNVGLLHSAGLAKPGPEPWGGYNLWDTLLTTIAIMGGTGPIHGFMDLLGKGKSG